MSAGTLRRKLRLNLRGAQGGISVAASIVLAFVAFGSTAGCRSTPTLTERELAGKKLYLGRCAHCHEENDLGLKKVPPDLHRLFQSPKLPSGAPSSDSEVARAVLAGKGMMPAFAGRFNDDQMSALLAYLHTGLR
jgi:mono/diheme cytochrome c family protein